MRNLPLCPRASVAGQCLTGSGAPGCLASEPWGGVRSDWLLLTLCVSPGLLCIMCPSGGILCPVSPLCHTHQCVHVPLCCHELWLPGIVLSCSATSACAAAPGGPVGLPSSPGSAQLSRACADTPLLPGPPSAPRNLVYSLRQSSLVLEWSAPADAGGRSDLTYSLWCGRCPPALRGRCEQCGSGVGFLPQQTGLVDRTVTLVNLLPHVNYTIRVVAVNGVSGVSPLLGQQYAEVNVSTGLAGMAAV